MRKVRISVRRLRVMLPVSLAWGALAIAATTASSPFDVVPALAIVGSPIVGFGWGWVLEVDRR